MIGFVLRWCAGRLRPLAGVVARLGLRGQLFALVAVAVAVPMVLLVANFFQQHAGQVDEVHRRALHLARLAAEAQARRNDGIRVLLTALARSEEVQAGRMPGCERFLQAVVSDYPGPGYADIGVADLAGRVTCHAAASRSPLQIGHRAYFQRVVAYHDFAVGEFAIGMTSGVPVVTFGYPVRDARKHVTGLVYAGFRLEALSRWLEQMDVPEGASVTVADRRGRILARAPDGARWIGHDLGQDLGAEVLARMAASGGTGVLVEPDGVRRVHGVVALRDARGEPAMFVSLGLRADTELAPLEARLRWQLGGVGVLGLLLFAGTWGAASVLIRRPVEQLLDATRRLAAGDLSARAPDLMASSELAELRDAFNQMAARLEVREVHLRKGQRLEAIGQLAGGIAHDFNNLLTVILGYAESLKDRLPASGPEAADLAELEAAAQRAARLTQQLLAFSRRQTLRPEPIRLDDLVVHLQAMLVRMLPEDIRLVVSAGSGLGIVHADRAQMEQVILNLVLNARDAMPEGGTLVVETARERVPPGKDATSEPMPAGDYVVLRVRDTGVGMDEATRSRVFEPFFTTKGQLGTGLGLATVYGIVKQSGGYIWCASKPGAGTTFSVFLPVAADADAGPAGRPSRTTRAPAGRGERIVVVEDDPTVRALLANVLGGHGYDVRSTGDPAEALAWLAAEPPVHLLVSDVVMPGMSGPVLHRTATARCPGLRVLFVSGYSHDAERRVSQIPSGLPYLQKPLTPAMLLSKVREVLDASWDLPAPA